MKAMRERVFGAAVTELVVIPVHYAGAWAHWGAGGVSAGRIGEGWAHAGYGGVSAGRAGEGWAHAGYGGAAYGYHNTFVGVHNTYVVGAHPAGGCYNCGAAAAAVGGLAVGAMAGAAIASASQPSTTVVVQQPAPVVVVGSQVATLPGGCERMTVNGTTYYQCGPSWYKSGFGADGVYYQAVPVP